MAYGSLDVSESLRKATRSPSTEDPAPVPEEPSLPRAAVYLLLLLLLCSAAFLWTRPLDLPLLEEQITARYWQIQEQQVAQEIKTQYAQVSEQQQYQLFRKRLQDLKQDPRHEKTIATRIKRSKEFLEQDGKPYPFFMQAFTHLQASDGLYHRLLKLAQEIGIEYWLSFVFGLLSLIVVFFAGRHFGSYGGLFAAGTLVLHHTMYESAYVGIIDAHALTILLSALAGFALLRRWWIMGAAFLGVAFTTGTIQALQAPLLWIAGILSFTYGCYRCYQGNTQVLPLCIWFLVGIIAIFLDTTLVALPALAVLLGYGFSIIQPHVRDWVHALALDFRYPSLILLLIMMGFLFSMSAYPTPLPIVDDSIVQSAQWLAVRSPGRVVTSHWTPAYAYYTGHPVEERADLLLGEGQCENCMVIVLEDHLGRLPALAHALGRSATKASINQCQELNGTLLCGDYRIEDEPRDPPGYYADLRRNITRHYGPGKALLVFEDQGVHALTIDQAHKDSNLARMLTRQRIPGYELAYHEAMPRHVVIYRSQNRSAHTV